MILKRLFLASLLGATALTSVANAEGYYVQFNGGGSASTDAGDDVKQKMDNSVVYGLEFGAKVNQSFRVGLSLDYRPNYSAKTYTYEGQLVSTVGTSAKIANVERSYNYKVKSWVAMANLYYDITEINAIVPYVHFGLGMARNKTKLDTTQYSTDTNPPPEGDVYSYKNTKTNFAYKLGLGIRHALNDQFDIDVRYQYSDLGKFEAKNVVSGLKDDNIANRKGKLRSHDLLLGVAFKF